MMRLQEIRRQEIIGSDNTDKGRDQSRDHDIFITLPLVTGVIEAGGAMLPNSLDLGFLSLH